MAYFLDKCWRIDNGDTNGDDNDGVYGDDDEVLVAVEGYLVCPEKLAGGLREGGGTDEKVDYGQVHLILGPHQSYAQAFQCLAPL